MTPCDPGQLSLYLDGVMSPKDRARMEAHIARCPTCTREMEELQRLDRVLVEWGARRMRLPADTDGRIRRSVDGRRSRPLRAVSRMMPAAVGTTVAAILVALGANLGWLYQSQSHLGPPAVAARSTISQSSPLVNAGRIAEIHGRYWSGRPDPAAKYQSMTAID
ncbi:MAG: zf-HC2 domain-containing protein [Chloroflexi bacterium]|nr:zf-HC2 domain-containing protein [Chloroflexota bacterium]